MSEYAHVYTAVIVDDDEIDRLYTQSFIKHYPFIKLIGAYATAADALADIEVERPDVLLLDIDMDGMNGFDLRRKLGDDQACIFITSYPDYALESFELAALDFIVKPLNRERFDMAMHRLNDYLNLKHKANLFDCTLGADAIFIKDGHEHLKIQLHDIIYLEALKDYTRIVTTTKKYCVLSMLGNLLQEAAFKTFVRIHRSYAVQKNFIDKVTPQHVYVNNITLPLGRSYKTAVDEIIA